MRAGDDGVVLAHALEAQHLAGEHEGVARRELLDEIFLDLAEHAAGGEHAGRLERAALQRASRTRTIGASTMVPTFSRYCWAMRGWATR